MTTAQLRQLLTLARREPCFEQYIQRKRKDVQHQLERKTMYSDIGSLYEIAKQELMEMGWSCAWDENHKGNACTDPDGNQVFVYGTTPSEVGGAWCYLLAHRSDYVKRYQDEKLRRTESAH